MRGRGNSKPVCCKGQPQRAAQGSTEEGPAPSGLKLYPGSPVGVPIQIAALDVCLLKLF